MQFKQINLEEFNEQKALDYLELKNQSLQQTLLEDPKIARYLDFADYLLSYHFQQTIHKKAHEKLLVEMFNTDYILSKLYGLELHKIKEYFVKFGNRIKISGFVLLLLKLIQFQLDEVPYMINGLRELAEKIAQNGIITFEQFVAYYMSCSENDEQDNIQHAYYKITESKSQDTMYHKHEIQKAIYTKSIQKIALLEENQPQIYLLGTDFQIHKEIKLDNPDTHYIILDFDFAENIKEFCCSLSNNHILFLSFMDQLHNNKLVQCEYLLTKIQYLQMLDHWGSVTTNQQLILWHPKTHQQTRVPLQLQGGKIQSIIELQKNEMICLQTDMKRVHIFNPKFEQLIVIQDSLLIQTFIFYEAGQCFYSINFTHKIQKWLIEENGVDYTKDKTIQICKPEYTVLAIGFVQDLLVTYDSSNQIRVFDTEDFRKLTTYKKILKPTNHMKIIEINKYQFIIVGNRISSFEIDVRIEEKQLSNKDELEKHNEDFETQMKSTKLLMQQILKHQPQVVNFRGTKHQDQIESILEQIKGAKSQLLPKIKVKEIHHYTELPDEYIREKIEEIEKNIYANKLLKDRIHQATEPFVETQPDPIDPKILQKLQPLQQGFQKIDHKHNQSEQNGSKIQSVRQLQNNSKVKKKLDILNFDLQEKSIRSKIDPLLDTDTNFLFKQLKDDYLNVQSKKSTKTQSLCYESRYEYQTQRGKLKKQLFTTQYKTKGQKIKTIQSIQPTNQTINQTIALSRTSRNSRNTTNPYSSLQQNDQPPPIPLECIPQMEKVKLFYNEAVKAMNYLKEQNQFLFFDS
ncbi:unnamed protein product [Paramecium primaurelia]|uniref:Uncharacterized protein n=2 Tax=Paramecium TaxID=5884 RepID=A0A8S1UTD5_9CILI|nr:unnamed protein product [Paramecium primaurelia]CAD8167744.1 unnamed protein product [Paramecium pentaurelia]